MKIKTKESIPELSKQVLYLLNMNSEVGVSYQFRNLKIEKGTEDTVDSGGYPNAIFTNTISVKKNTQYVYGLTDAGTLPAHIIRYLKTDGTYIKSDDIVKNTTSGIRTLTFDDDYNIEIMFQNGLSNNEKMFLNLRRKIIWLLNLLIKLQLST